MKGSAPRHDSADGRLPRAVPGYDFDGPVERGGFGEIVPARRVADGRRLVLKIARVSKWSAREQLTHEVDALKAIGRSLAPDLLDNGVLPDGTPWLALERMEAPSLAALLRNAAPFRGPALTTAMLAVVDAVADLHALGWRHHDLKPGHVFLDGSTVRLIDFGLASMVGDPRPPPSSPAAGTAAYMSPEQVKGDPADARADVYAVGAILFELATGSPPFTGAPGEVRQAHLALRPPRPSERVPLSNAVEDVILRCLSKDPDARFGDGRSLREALRSALAAPDQAPAVTGRPVPIALPRRTVGVVRLLTDTDILVVSRTLDAMGAKLASAVGRSVAVVFEPGARENAVRLALDGAAALLESGVAKAALVDVATVPVLSTTTGRRYILQPPGEEQGFPATPGAIFLTPGAAAAVPEAAVSSCDDRLLRLVPSPEGGPPQPPLVGRAAVLAQLREAARSALSQRAPAIAIASGDAGMGKTRLGAALAAKLRELDTSPEVIEIRARDGTVGQDETLRALLCWGLEIDARAPPPPDAGRSFLERALPPGAARESWAPIALALGWLAPDARALSSWRAAPGALRAAAIRGVGDVLRERALVRPLCILLDDAHLADAAALDALEYAALAEAAVPLFVCALARPALAAARPGLGERASSRVAVTLEPLAQRDAAELCRKLLLPAENVPVRAVERLVERARGVPILLVELVRGLRAHGLVRQRGRDGAWYVATDELEQRPDLPLVDWLAQREMAGLPDALAAHARLIALLVDEVARPEVAGIVAELDREGVVGSGALDPEVATRRLVEVRVLIERGGRVAFRHPLLREAIARSAPEPEQRAIHRAAFRYYLIASALAERERLPRLAIHAEACGLRAEAASLWLQIAESLRARHAYLEAETQYTRALSQLAQEDVRGRFLALRGRGGMRYRLGRYEDALSDLGEARRCGQTLGDRHGETECLLEQATALDWMNDYAGSAEAVTAAEALVHRGSSALVTTRLELARARTLFRAARFPEAVAALEAAAALAEPLGDDGYETLVISQIVLGALLPNLGRSDRAEAVLARAYDLAAARSDLLHLGAVLNNRRNLWVARGDVEHALDDQLAFLRIGRDLGMVGTEYVALFNLGELHYQANQLEAAAAHIARAVEIERRHPEVAARPVARLLMARMFTFRGDLAAARAWLAEVEDAETSADVRGRTGARLSVSDRILAEMVELSMADADRERWADLCARSMANSVEQEAIEVHEAHGLAALRAGRREEAEAALREALALADGIPNVMRPRVEARLAALRAGSGAAGRAS